MPTSGTTHSPPINRGHFGYVQMHLRDLCTRTARATPTIALILALLSSAALFPALPWAGCGGIAPLRALSMARLPRATPVYDQDAVMRRVAEYGTFFAAQREGRTSRGGHDRRHSLPLITGDGFLHLADEYVDNEADGGGRWGGRPEPDAGWCAGLGEDLALAEGQAVIFFVAAGHAGTFLRSCEGLISRPLVLVTHNGDDAMPGDDLARFLESPSLVHWFAQCCDRAHPKLTCLPIGLENRQWGLPRVGGSHGSAPELMLGMLAGLAPAQPAAGVALRVLEAARNGNTLEHSWAWFSLTPGGPRGEVRIPLHAMIIAGRDNSPPRASWIRTSGGASGRLEPHELYREMLTMTSVVCPRGNGLDAHRMWESLYLGRTTIVLAGPLDPLWEGLPALVLRSWDELLEEGAEARVLNATVAFAAHAHSLRVEKLFLTHWACLIGLSAHREAEFCSTEGLLRVLRGEGAEVRAEVRG